MKLLCYPLWEWGHRASPNFQHTLTKRYVSDTHFTLHELGWTAIKHFFKFLPTEKCLSHTNNTFFIYHPEIKRSFSFEHSISFWMSAFQCKLNQNCYSCLLSFAFLFFSLNLILDHPKQNVRCQKHLQKLKEIWLSTLFEKENLEMRRNN